MPTCSWRERGPDAAQPSRASQPGKNIRCRWLVLRAGRTPPRIGTGMMFSLRIDCIPFDFLPAYPGGRLTLNGRLDLPHPTSLPLFMLVPPAAGACGEVPALCRRSLPSALASPAHAARFALCHT